MKGIGSFAFALALVLVALLSVGWYQVSAGGQVLNRPASAFSRLNAPGLAAVTATPTALPDSIVTSDNATPGNPIAPVAPSQGVIPGGGPAVLPGGGAGPEMATPGGSVDTSNWLTYRDDTFKFEIRYPPSVVFQKTAAQADPQPLSQIAFQDAQLARSDTAALEPPLLTIDIYDNSAGLPLDQWLRDHRLIDSKSEAISFSVGGMTGVHVTSMLLLAPNEFYYLTRDTTIFRLVPMGAPSNQMLMTFRAVQ